MTSVSKPRIERPANDELSEAHVAYLARVPEADIVSVMERQIDEWRRLGAAVPPDKEEFRYAPGKWTVRDVFGHIVDAERVFGYRLLRVSRGDKTPLEGYEENDYVRDAHARLAPVAELVREFVAVREANLFVVRGLDETTSRREGTANGVRVTARAIAYAMAGHLRHHWAGLEESYGLRAGAAR